MTNHAKVFLESRGISGYDQWMCEFCGKIVAEARELDVHHIRYRSMGGKDEPENLIGACRLCHESFHSQNIHEETLKIRVEGILEYLEEIK
jgi:5-methylcytosine-specific restriction endonuclease McrA